MIDRIGANATVCRGMMDDTTKPETEAQENGKNPKWSPAQTLPYHPTLKPLFGEMPKK
jgi:hypothetical protein